MSARVIVSPADLRPGELTLRGDEYHYLCKVRRLAVGAQVVLLDGEGRMATAELRSIDKQGCQLWVDQVCELPAPSFRLHVAAALIKGERMDWAITKMVELGVDRISPLESERSVVRLGPERAAARHKRFESLAQAASRQSQNAHPPSIDPVRSLPAWLATSPAADLKLIPTLATPAEPLQSVLGGDPLGSALVIIGPEGGLSGDEVQMAVHEGFVPVSLGPRTLRAETACIYMASVLGFRYGDVGRR